MSDIKALLREAGQFITADEKTMDLLPKDFHANPDAYIRSLAAQLEAAAESLGEPVGYVFYIGNNRYFCWHVGNHEVDTGIPVYLAPQPEELDAAIDAARGAK